VSLKAKTLHHKKTTLAPHKGLNFARLRQRSEQRRSRHDSNLPIQPQHRSNALQLSF